MTEFIGGIAGKLYSSNKFVEKCYVNDKKDYLICTRFIKKILGYCPEHVGIILWKGKCPQFERCKRVSLRKYRHKKWCYTTSKRDLNKTKGLIGALLTGMLNKALPNIQCNRAETDFYVHIVELR